MPARTSGTERITILLATRNGAAHLRDQLASYRAQEDAAWDLWVSDDGSTDATPTILAEFQTEIGDRHAMRLLSGPKRGVVANFLSLLTHPDLPQGPVALSDQDDVWFPDKLARARAALAAEAPVTLYGAQSIHTNVDLREIGRSRAPQRPPTFANALTQNIVSGHSTVLSAAALALVREAGPVDVPHHDWWLYQLISGAGGTVKIDPEPVLFYRQHGQNTMGAHRGALASLRRAGQVLGRTYGCWIDANTTALAGCSELLTAENRALLAAFRALPRNAGLARLRALSRLGLYRQGRLATAAFHLAATLGRI